MKLSPVLLGLLASMLAGVAHAQVNTDLEQCRTISNNPDLAIKHCTAAIDSGKLSPRDRAQAHLNSGVEWFNKND